MELLAVAATAVVVLGGCYTPSLRDCTVSCAAQSECSGDQICGSDGLCAAPDVAGHCGMMMGSPPPDAPVVEPPDAGPAPDAAPPVDAPKPPPPQPDAPTMATLRVQIDGKGNVLVDGFGACTATQGPGGDCSYQVPIGVAQTVRAIPSGFDQKFSAWNSPTCRSAGATCTFTPTASVTIVAKFDKAQ